MRKYNRCRAQARVSFSARAEKHDSDYIDLFSPFARAQNPRAVSETGLGFSAWVEIKPMLKPSPCNGHFHFKPEDFFQNPGWILSPVHRAEISYLNRALRLLFFKCKPAATILVTHTAKLNAGNITDSLE